MRHHCPPLPGPRLLLAFALPLLAAVLLAACETEPKVTLTLSTPTAIDAGDAQPDPSGTPLALVSPEELEQRLLGGDQPLPGLPEGYAVDTTERITPEQYPAMPKLGRGVRYTLDGPDYANSVTYYLHATPADAHEDLGLVLNAPFPSEQVLGLGYLARALNSGSPDGQVGTTRVYVLAGQTIIEAVSSVAGASAFGNMANATALARAAIAHLQAVAPE